VIHADTKDYLEVALIRAQQNGKKINGKPYNLSDFISVTKEVKNLPDMEEYTSHIFECFRSAILNRNENGS
jgi:hypothetical protein